MSEVVKHCPSCREEFQSWVERCIDCDVPLHLGPSSAAEQAPPPEMPPVAQLDCVFAGNSWLVREFAELLQAQGIRCRVDAYPPRSEPDADARETHSRFGRGAHGVDLGVYVAPADLSHATELIQRSEREALGVSGQQPDADLCPGCDNPLAPDADECPSCGLAFPEA